MNTIQDSKIQAIMMDFLDMTRAIVQNARLLRLWHLNILRPKSRICRMAKK